MISTWWEGHGWSAIPQAILPRLGALAVGDDSTPLAAAWLYMDNSVGVAMLEWLVSNPEAPPRQVLRALRAVVDFLKAEAEALDYGVVLATCRQASLSAVLCKEGFQVTDSGVIHHISTRTAA